MSCDLSYVYNKVTEVGGISSDTSDEDVGSLDKRHTESWDFYFPFGISWFFVQSAKKTLISVCLVGLSKRQEEILCGSFHLMLHGWQRPEFSIWSTSERSSLFGSSSLSSTLQTLCLPPPHDQIVNDSHTIALKIFYYVFYSRVFKWNWSNWGTCSRLHAAAPEPYSAPKAAVSRQLMGETILAVCQTPF